MSNNKLLNRGGGCNGRCAECTRNNSGESTPEPATLITMIRVEPLPESPTETAPESDS